MEKVEALPEKFLPMKIFDLAYGESGTAKSEYWKAVTKQALRENPGKLVRFIIGDGSGATYEPIVRKGKGHILEFVHRPWPLDTMNKLTSGWRLKDEKDPTSELLAPDADYLSQFCITIFEGFNPAGKYIMGSVKGGMAYRAANGEQMGPDAIVSIFEGERDAKGNLKEGPGTSFGTNGTAHYMAAQGHLLEFAQRSRSLHGHVGWSAHELIMDDSVNIGDLKNPVKIKKGVVIGGPDTGAGKALTPNLQRIFNNTFHCQTLGISEKAGTDEATGQAFHDHKLNFRLWTRDHHAQQGATSVKFKALTRNVPKDFPPYFDSEEKGRAVLDYYAKIHECVNTEMEDF